MPSSDSSLAGRCFRRFLLKPTVVLSLFAGTAFVPANKIAEDDAAAYTFESRTADPKVMQLREWVAGYAQNFVGIRYRHAGHSPNTGFDCSGFTNFIMKEFDLKVSCSSALQSTQGQKVSLDEILPGDLIFFGGKKYIQHVAMVVECAADGIICVHSTCSRGVVVENISTSKYWRPKILFARDVITGQTKSCRELASTDK